MQKKASKEWPEIIISSGDKNFNQSLRRAAKGGLIRKIGPKIYSSNLKDTPEEIVKRHRYQILSGLYPNGVISHRSALEGGISSDGVVFLTYGYTKTVLLPGLTIKLIQGAGPDPEDTPFLESLYISSRGRAFLENVAQSRARSGFIKRVSRQVLEEKLDRLARIYGQEELNLLRDQARRIGERLSMKKEFASLDKLIGSLLGTRTDVAKKTEVGRARARGEPFDPERIELFATLMAYLQNQVLPLYPGTVLSRVEKTNQAFFEAYFSNYIEGTVFAIEEAEKIIFENQIFPHRSEDSHDILGTFQIVSNQQMMETTPESVEQLIAILLKRHAILMEARSDKRPGQFKDIVNRAANTVFVKPEEVRGTLIKGFEFYKQLPVGIARAIFMMFLISEVHPFIDGNGRIARILMNAELDAAGQSRIIIPTVYREDYLLSLRRLSRKLDPGPYVRMLSYAQQFTASISYKDYHQTLAQFQACNAFLEPHEGKLITFS